MKIVRLLTIAAILVSPVAAHAVTTSPGKNSVHVSESGGLSGINEITWLQGQILKGKKKTVVEIQATLSVQQNAALEVIFLYARINGQSTPMGFINSQCDTAALGNMCTMTANFWMDIDAAEASFPGTFVGQPLDIVVRGGNTDFLGATNGLFYSANFTARVGKK